MSASTQSSTVSAPARRLTLVTGATNAYVRTLWQMLRSAERHGLAAAHRFVAFDLGLVPAQRATLARQFPWCEWRALDWAALPPHVAPAQRTYAWKPLALHAVAEECGERVLWLDSATLFHAPLDEFNADLLRHGVYTLAGQSTVAAHCAPAVRAALDVTVEMLDQPERVSGVVGVDTTQSVPRELLREWHDLALDPRYWRPVAPNHKPDQAVLSVLIYRRVLAGQLTLNPGEVDISCSRPVRWLSTRNKVPPWLPRWTDLAVRTGYALYKAGDRLAIRARRFKHTRIEGWHRWPKERFRTFVGRVGGAAFTEVPAPHGGYYADPFLWKHADSTWLFVEEFRYRENAGRLVAIPLDENLNPGDGQPLELRRGHLSFPFLCAHEGELLLLPESSHHGTVDLFACEHFPTRWRLRRRLLDDIDAADSVLLPHAGRCWLFTSVRLTADDPGRALAIFFTDDLLGGSWQPHPMNAERRYANHPYSFGRCAGPIVRLPSGDLVRPIHASRRYYGERVELMRIDALTPEHFVESPFREGPHAALCARAALHHLTVHGELVACDLRDRVSYRQHVSWLRDRSSLPPAPPADFHCAAK